MGYFGNSCASCTQCLHGTCHEGLDGSCSPCLAGWTGAWCDRCADGFSGPSCVTLPLSAAVEVPTWIVLVGASAGAVLLIVIVGAVGFAVLRRRSLRKRKLRDYAIQMTAVGAKSVSGSTASFDHLGRTDSLRWEAPEAGSHADLAASQGGAVAHPWPPYAMTPPPMVATSTTPAFYTHSGWTVPSLPAAQAIARFPMPPPSWSVPGSGPPLWDAPTSNGPASRVSWSASGNGPVPSTLQIAPRSLPSNAWYPPPSADATKAWPESAQPARDASAAVSGRSFPGSPSPPAPAAPAPVPHHPIGLPPLSSGPAPSPPPPAVVLGAWLRSADPGLVHLEDALVRNGYDGVDLVAAMGPEDLNACGIPRDSHDWHRLGHAIARLRAQLHAT